MRKFMNHLIQIYIFITRAYIITKNKRFCVIFFSFNFKNDTLTYQYGYRLDFLGESCPIFC